MKNHIFLIKICIIIFTFCVLVGAQTNQIGFIAGINIANLDEKDTDFKSLTGFSGGGVLDFALGG